jgi:cystathionine beta-lyase
MDFEDLDLKLSGVKVLLLCNPHNPVGRVWSREALAQLGALCVKHDVKIFADEIHGEFVFSDHPYTPMATVSEAAAAQTTTLLSASKTFNLAGLHASFAVFGNPGDQSVFERALGLLDLKRNNCFSLVAVEAAYSGGAKWLEALKEYIEDNLNFVCGEIHKRIPELSVTMPEGTYLLWIDCNGLGLTDEALARFMAEKAGLALGAGISYGQEGSGYMRMNAACSRSVLEQALGKLEEAVRALK